MAELSPMMQQYLEIKNQHKDEILFYRIGDFYEMFFDDALTASRELDLTLTGKQCGLEERAPMCGVPFHSYESYVARLIAKGYKVAICEQTEDPAQAKGLVKRDIIRVITPGTVIDETSLEAGRSNFCAGIWLDERYAALCASAERPVQSALSAVLTYLRGPAAAFLLGLVGPGVFLLPALSALQGFFLSYSVACFAAALGLVCVFCGAVNCPIASMVLSIELFGAGQLVYFALACGIAYMLSGYFGLYSSQKILYSKLRTEFINIHAK